MGDNRVVPLPARRLGGEAPASTAFLPVRPGRDAALFAGQPLKEGVVRFIPIDGKSATASALIADGKFSERVPAGTHRVEISSPKLPQGLLSSKQMKRGTVDENVALEELIPARYNLQSKLTTEVKSGKNQSHFPLKSK